MLRWLLDFIRKLALQMRKQLLLVLEAPLHALEFTSIERLALLRLMDSSS